MEPTESLKASASGPFTLVRVRQSGKLFPMSWRAMLLGCAALVGGCSSPVELGRERLSTGGGSAVGDNTAGEPSDGAAVGGGGSAGAGGTSTGGLLDIVACEGLPTASAEEDQAGTVCERELAEVEVTPVDAYIMMDRSDSMAEMLPNDGVTRWEAIREAISSFVNDPDAEEAQIRLGISFFNRTGGYLPEIDCDLKRYSAPDVAIGSIAETGEDILGHIDSYAADDLTGQTPLLPALQGALEYAEQWNSSSDSLGRPTVVILVTDGVSTVCQEEPTVQEVAALAESYARHDPPIRTFVVGTGDAVGNLQQIAIRGGTSEPFLVEDGGASESLLTALKQMTLSHLACVYTVPPVTNRYLLLNTDEVRMVYWPDREGRPEAVQEIPRAPSRAACGMSTHGGWYYDDEDNPTKIHACPCTCSLFRKGAVEIQYGCTPRPI